MSTKEERRDAMVATLNRYVIRHGFHDLKMDQIAQIMGISRGKLYLYFSSKDEVIEAVVDRYYRFMDGLVQSYPQDNGKAVLEAFASVYVDGINLIAATMPAFLQDLKQDVPAQYLHLEQRLALFQDRVITYLRAGIQMHVFNDEIAPQLVVLQLTATIRQLLEVDQSPLSVDFFGTLDQLFRLERYEIVDNRFHHGVSLAAESDRIHELQREYLASRLI